MNETQFAQRLIFLVSQRHQDEATVLAEAVREGVSVLYRETLIEAYLLGNVSRDVVLQELGPEKLEEIEYQRDAFKHDVEWGLTRE